MMAFASKSLLFLHVPLSKWTSFNAHLEPGCYTHLRIIYLYSNQSIVLDEKVLSICFSHKAKKSLNNSAYWIQAFKS